MPRVGRQLDVTKSAGIIFRGSKNAAKVAPPHYPPPSVEQREHFENYERSGDFRGAIREPSTGRDKEPDEFLELEQDCEEGTHDAEFQNETRLETEAGHETRLETGTGTGTGRQEAEAGRHEAETGTGRQEAETEDEAETGHEVETGHEAETCEDWRKPVE